MNRVRTSLLLVTDEELRKVRKLPAHVQKPQPIVQMQLEPQVQKGSRSFKASELMKVMPNSFEYKTLARNISPVPFRDASDSENKQGHPLPAKKISSHSFYKPPRLSQISPPPQAKVIPSRVTARDEFL